MQRFDSFFHLYIMMNYKLQITRKNYLIIRTNYYEN